MKSVNDVSQPTLGSVYWARLAFVTLLIAVVSLLNAQLPSAYGPIAPIWIPAGIGLAALLIWGWRLWPALFLGSLSSTSLLVYMQGLVEADWLGAFAATVIAIGNTLEGLLACYLVHRWVGWPSALTQTQSILRFLAAVTVLPGALSATFAITVATWYGSIYPEDYVFAWLTWLVSEALGNSTVTIVLLVLGGSPSALWRTRRIGVALPTMLIALLASTVLVYQSRTQLAAARDLHDHHAVLIAKQLNQTVSQLLAPIFGVRSFFESSNFVDRSEFRSFVSPTLERLPQLRAMEWVPAVAAADVANLIAQANKDGIEDFRLTEERQKELMPARPSAIHYPVFYAEPLASNRKALGFDMGSNPSLMAMLKAAERSGQPVASPPVSLVHDDGSSFATLVALPIFADDSKRLAGFAVSVYDINEVMESVIRLQPLPANTRLRMLYAPAQLRGSLGISPSNQKGTEVFDTGELKRAGPGHALASVPTWRQPMVLAQARWIFEFTSNDRFIHELRDFSSYFTLLVTLLVTVIVVAFLLIVTGQTYTVRQQVVEQTAELSRTNKKLIHEAQRHQITSKRLKQRSRELQRSNEELSHFAYIASHDLQEPLRSITGFTQLLKSRYQGQLDERADDYIRFITTGAERMRTLIVDLLSFSRLDQHKSNDEPIDVDALVRMVLDDLKQAIEDSDATINYKNLGTVNGDKSRLRLVLQNLIGNAIKYQPEGQQPIINVSVLSQKNHWLFEVNDNGIGIAEEFRDNVFVIFKRLHHKNEYSGTGIGLAMVKKIVEQRAGKVWVEGATNGGTRFRFTWPKITPLDAEAELEALIRDD